MHCFHFSFPIIMLPSPTDSSRPNLTTSLEPLPFWSAAVILTICILFVIFLFLFLSDFCCELVLCQTVTTEHKMYPSNVNLHEQYNHLYSNHPFVYSSNRLQPTAPPAEDVVPQDTVVTIVPDHENNAGYWTSYLNFCRRIETSDTTNTVVSNSNNTNNRNSYSMWTENIL